MVEVLSEIKIGPRIIEPIVKVLKKKPEMLEEQEQVESEKTPLAVE